MLQYDEDSEGGPPAQTGSLTHAGVAEFHRLTEQSLDIRRKGAWDAIAKASEIFPLADKDEVRLFITPYMNDPRNIEAKIVSAIDPITKQLTPLIEQEMNFTLPPHSNDPTGEPIHVQGHMDFVRERMGIYYNDDLKTGKKTGWEMLHDYAIQQAAYCYGIRQYYGIPVHPGNIIRAHGYRVRNADLPSPDGVFWASAFVYDDVDWILEKVRLAIADIRRGDITFGPGPHCTYCEFGGLTGCIPEFKKRQKHLQQLELIQSKG
jgi:hypothetical protein